MPVTFTSILCDFTSTLCENDFFPFYHCLPFNGHTIMAHFLSHYNFPHLTFFHIWRLIGPVYHLSPLPICSSIKNSTPHIFSYLRDLRPMSISLLFFLYNRSILLYRHLFIPISLHIMTMVTFHVCHSTLHIMTMVTFHVCHSTLHI